MKQEGFMKTSRIAVIPLAALALTLGACGSDTDPETAAAVPPPAAKPTVQPEQSPVDPTAKMARAVGSGKPGAAVDIKYDFKDRPEVGKPVEVKIAFIPGAGVESLEAKISDMDGITVAGGLNPQFNNVQAGQPYEHTFSLLANRAGVFYVSVEVTTHFGEASTARTFAIPLAVGDIAAEQGQKKKSAPTRDATGEAIESMPAKET
jgi:hypothetical protein